MIIIHTKAELEDHFLPIRMHSKNVGFVPTMGALHDGHISLINRAKQENDVVIASVFINPKQFNNSEDLRQYPKREKEDVELLLKNGCDFVFIPSIEEIYPEDYKNTEVDLDGLENKMEGKFRPGHFEGVVNIVSRLFDLVQPTKAYFGRKDFQQVAVVKKMTTQLKFPVEIVSVETKRTPKGLAMSSRNLRLNNQQLEDALIIYKVLKQGSVWAKKYSPFVTREKMIEYFKSGALTLEYLEIIHPDTLESLNQEWTPGATACIAAFCGEVRLIDSMELIDNQVGL